MKQTKMTIVWATDTTYSGKVYFGEGDTFDKISEIRDLKKVQKVILKNLTPKTRYSYQVEVSGYALKQYSF